MNLDPKDSNTKVWYNSPAPEQDVVVSTRVRLSRNLASFPFPANFKQGDSGRVQNIIFDSFSKFSNPDNFQMMSLSNLDSEGEKILTECGLYSNSGTGLVTTLDGVSACLVNADDHVKISSFASGLDLEPTYDRCCKIDEQMQESVQFAASRDFGYLNSSIFNTGSGLKSSLRFHLPALSYSGEMKTFIKDIQRKGFLVSDCFGVGTLFDSSLGAYYEVSTMSCFNGSEIDQLAGVSSIASLICEFERKKRQNFADNKPTVVHNIVVRAYSLAKFSVLLSLRECIDLISCIKWGLDSGFIAGVEDYELNSLLYRIQSGHLGYMLNTGNFSFEEDVSESPELKEDRLRAIVIKSVVDKISFVS
ncbi:hypothetical protein [Treponema sp.]|uniref:hypothetical protein n=1 Tax=Treponema sp. TaxID=166 RepID=UPI00298D70F1|nr:hypothetical protein [Treponema sp.]MCR5614428.1 hypothetical protein [Treponema sp.]